jgi:hypothetical protein
MDAVAAISQASARATSPQLSELEDDGAAVVSVGGGVAGGVPVRPRTSLVGPVLDAGPLPEAGPAPEAGRLPDDGPAPDDGPPMIPPTPPAP